MKFKFTTTSDWHLGKIQYGSILREKDFYAAALDITRKLLIRKPDFMILAGDIHEHGAVNAVSLSNIEEPLKLILIRRQHIQVYAIPGNHDWPGDWLDYFQYRGLVVNLSDTPITWDYCPYALYGLPYAGYATTEKLVELCEQVIQAGAERRKTFNILTMHYGLEGYCRGDAVPLSVLPLVRKAFDIVIAGHIHKPYQHEDFWFSSGATEINAVDEVDSNYSGGGYLFDIDTEREPVVKWELVRSEKRQWLRNEVYLNDQDQLNQWVRAISIHQNTDHIKNGIYYLNLSAPTALDITPIRDALDRISALYVIRTRFGALSEQYTEKPERPTFSIREIVQSKGEDVLRFYDAVSQGLTDSEIGEVL